MAHQKSSNRKESNTHSLSAAYSGPELGSLPRKRPRRTLLRRAACRCSKLPLAAADPIFSERRWLPLPASSSSFEFLCPLPLARRCMRECCLVAHFAVFCRSEVWVKNTRWRLRKSAPRHAHICERLSRSASEFVLILCQQIRFKEFGYETTEIRTCLNGGWKITMRHWL